MKPFHYFPTWSSAVSPITIPVDSSHPHVTPLHGHRCSWTPWLTIANSPSSTSLHTRERQGNASGKSFRCKLLTGWIEVNHGWVRCCLPFFVISYSVGLGSEALSCRRRGLCIKYNCKVMLLHSCGVVSIPSIAQKNWTPNSSSLLRR